jgi:hypothetical protein
MSKGFTTKYNLKTPKVQPINIKTINISSVFEEITEVHQSKESLYG